MPHPKILLVEDNLLMRWWMLSTLEHEGFWVVAPANVDEAFRVAVTMPFDILITDWRLPDGYDGIQVLSEVRNHSPEIVAVMISAEADSELTDRALQAGFDRVIAKPFPVMEILGAVQHLSRNREEVAIAP